MVSDGITETEAAKIGAKATPDFEQALADALAYHGKQARIGVVTHGADIMGQFKNSEAVEAIGQ
jgi:hypothetical protein